MYQKTLFILISLCLFAGCDLRYAPDITDMAWGSQEEPLLPSPGCELISPRGDTLWNCVDWGEMYTCQAEWERWEGDMLLECVETWTIHSAPAGCSYSLYDQSCHYL